MTQAHFNGLAHDYAAFRPSYPISIYEPALRRLADRKHLNVLDAGCGTGINTRVLDDLLRPGRDLGLVGVDISEDMLREAGQLVANARFLLGGAEKIDLPAASQDLIVAAQAVQWFDRPAFYREALRLLNEGGLLALLENNRDWRSSAFLDEYESFLESHSIKDDGSHYSRFYRDHPYRTELGELFAEVEEHHERWSRRMTVSEFVGMARSSTQVQRIVKRCGVDFLETALRELLLKHFPSEAVEVPYDTVLYVGRKAGQR